MMGWSLQVHFGLPGTKSVRVRWKMVNILTDNLMHLSQAFFCLSHLLWLNKVSCSQNIWTPRGEASDLSSENCCTATSLKLNTEFNRFLTENRVISIFHNAAPSMCGLRAASVVCKHDEAALTVEVVNLNGPGSVETNANITRRSSIPWLGVFDFSKHLHWILPKQ